MYVYIKLYNKIIEHFVKLVKTTNVVQIIVKNLIMSQTLIFSISISK